MLHLKPEGQVTATNKNIQSETERVYFRLVPILANGPNGRVVETVALLDSASDISLIDVDLCKDLGLKGERSSLVIKTLNSVSKKDSKKVSLDIRATDDLDSPILHIKEAWTMNSDAFCCPPQITRRDWKHITQLNIPHIDPSQVKLLIGLNVPEAHIQTDVVAGEADQPYAVRTMIGWSIMGVSPNDFNTQSLQATVKLTVSKHIALHEKVERFWKTESFGVAHDNNHSVSAEDRRAQRILDNTTRLVDGHYEVGMLWKHDDPKLPNNQFLAEKRLRSLARRLVNDKDFACVYADTLNGYVSTGFASKITDADIASSSTLIWYLPHNGVTNPNKPGKVRVVFDAAADFSGTSLNDNLLTGPDLLNSLFGLLARFRLFSVVITADIEAMFHQVSVPDSDSNTLRFLWKQDFSKPGPPEHYKMNVHIFGAADSPCCANYAVKRTPTDNADMFSSTTVDTVLNDFYVDDLLKAIETPTEAISLSRELTQLMKLGGFRLHKWISNSPEVLNTIPESERSIQPVDLDLDQLPVQRALGLKWNVNDDCFIFGSKRKEVVFTKRGIVSLVSTIFDPAGFLAPFTFRVKCLIQDLWRERLDWDDPIPENHRKVWSEWLSELDQLSTFTLSRHHPHMSSKIDWIELHIFRDASEKGFGAAAYLRYSVKTRGLFCSFVASKTHVAPVKNALSIPRLELQGAVIGTRLCNTLKTELKLTFQKVTL